MKLPSGLILALLFAACPVLAQTSSRDMKGGLERPQSSTHVEPGTPAKPAQPAAEVKAAAPAAEKVDPAKDAAIRHLLDLTEESKMGERIGNYVAGQVHDGMSRSLPPERLQKFMETFSQRFAESAPPGTITDAMVSIYAKHLSQEDIQAAVQFYESPVGQRFVKAMPEVSKESQTEVLEMDRKAMMATLRGMSDEYPELKPLLPADPSRPASPPAPATAPSPASAPGAAAVPKPATPPTPTPAPAPDSTPAPKPAPAPPQE